MRENTWQTRESNIELLRILAMAGVIIIHYNYPEAGGAFSYVRPNSFNEWVLYCLESLVICAVDLFMVISGYFMCNSAKRNLWKPLELLTQVILFREGIYILQVFLGEPFAIKSILENLVPANYFVILYCTVYLISPYVGFAMDKLHEQDLKRLMILFFILFSVYPTATDILEVVTGQPFTGLNSVGVLGDFNGYSVVNFLLCWTIGAYLRKTKCEFNRKKSLSLYFAVSCAILFYAKGMMIKGASLALAFSYCNPLVILEAVSIFVFFKELKTRYVKPINLLARGTFSVYLLHEIFLKHIGIQQHVSRNIIILLIHIVLSVSIIYFLCWSVYLIYEAGTKHIRKCVKKRIDLPDIGITHDSV